MKLSDFDFHLPEQLIATRPVKPRPSAKLLYAHGEVITDRVVYDLRQILRAGDLLVLNNTRVIPARLFGERRRETGQGTVAAKIEVTLIGPTVDGHWRALVKPLRKVEVGEDVQFEKDLSAKLIAKDGGEAVFEFNLKGTAFDTALEEIGKMPLPPYIAAKRAADAQDNQDYQTVFAKEKGAVAAPTASLHFNDDLLEDLAAIGVERTEVTLHVGAGTFLPVKVDDIRDHKMHSEWGQVGPEAVTAIKAAKARGGRVIPVGTTALRLVETAARDGGIAPWTGDTDIFIYPGFEFQVADGLMTNFHLPKSTLMMLVSALMGKERIERIYKHAIENEYRFFSYGDASLLLPAS
jgi:S-adenosylmethionine:tRNA ribosyltransferase-isomerase